MDCLLFKEGGLDLHGLHFNKKSPQEFTERVKEVINTQFRNEDRAVFWKERYRLRKQGLLLSAKEYKIDKVPLSILEVMFEKAASLIQVDRLVILKPGSSDDSYVVAGTCNRIFCVTQGKGGSFKCDRTCINSTVNICEHVIAVAEKCGQLPDFVQWLWRSKWRPSLTGIALNGAPKSVEKRS